MAYGSHDFYNPRGWQNYEETKGTKLSGMKDWKIWYEMQNGRSPTSAEIRTESKRRKDAGEPENVWKI